MSGLILYLSGDVSHRAGFCLLFSLAALARYASTYFLKQMDEPPHRRDPASDFTFLMFVARFRESNFLKFVVFSACLTFATYLSAPFFAVFMLRDLQLSYLTYMALQVCSSFASLVAQHEEDRKSTRLNSSHLGISYAVFCLKKKNKQIQRTEST